ncbi:type II secretion system protein [Vibrio ulleungensis]|uniref:type II secretion system protein n=1 Tax=Vibrio ulleungensis TaxID=2807619 RepID=UPI002E2C13A1|nr:type II secretion system protein [Vibrio ulleungensis]
MTIKPFPHLKQQLGFTLIELIVVVILLAIVAVYAASKFIGVGEFSGYAAQDQSINVIRQIQLGRMQSNIEDINDPSCTACKHYQLSVTNQCLGSVAACSSSGEQFSDKVFLDNTELSFSPSIQVSFDLLGNPTCSGSCTMPITIDITNQFGDKYPVCINSQGYVYDC